MHRLSIGAGRDRRPGWKTLDADPANQPDFLATVPPLPEQVQRVAWDAIEMLHVVEHFPPWVAAELLGEIHAVLAPGGLLVLEQQDPVAFGFRASFLALTAVGFAASLLCFIAYWIDRRHRRNQAVAALQYMNQIETNLSDPS